MATMTATRGLSEAEYRAARGRFKAALPFPVNMRRATQAYCLGSISVLPTKARKCFTAEQAEAVRALLVAEGFHCPGLADYDAYAFHQGFGYMRKIVEAR